MINSVGGSQFMMPGMQRTPGANQQRPVADRAASSEEAAASSSRQAQTRTAPEAPARMMAEPRGVFVDCYA